MNAEPIVQFEEREDITVGHIRAASVLDAVNVDQFGAEIMNFVQKRTGAHLLLDFEHVDYLSSAVLTELIRIHHILVEGNGSLRLCALNKDIRKVFEITNLEQMFVIYDTHAAEGVRRFARSLDVAAQEDAWSELQRDL